MNATKNTMTLDKSGKVGINLGHDVAPVETLDVNGNCKATAFIGDGSALTNLPVNAQIDINTQHIISMTDQLSAVPDFDPIAGIFFHRICLNGSWINTV